MSKIGKKPIKIPEGVSISIDDGHITAKGKKGELSRDISNAVSIFISDDVVTVSMAKTKNKHDAKEFMAQWGLYRSLIQNMIIGVSEGFIKALEFKGVGFKAVVKGDTLDLNLGFSHPISCKAPDGITFKVEKNIITVSGIDKEIVGRVAAKVRAYRPPEPYKGSGIRYVGEYVRKKAGKKAAAVGA